MSAVEVHARRLHFVHFDRHPRIHGHFQQVLAPSESRREHYTDALIHR